MPLRAALAASRLFTARRRAAHVAISVARRRGVFVSGLLQISSWGGSLPPGGSSAVLTSIRFNGLFARWETSFLQNCPLQIRLVLSTTGPFRVRTRGLGAISDRFLRMLLRHSWGRGLVAGVLARVVHGRRVGEGTAFVQWGGVRVEGASGGGAPFVCPQDRLRQAQGERRGFEARLRCGLVGACRRPAHLWIPAFAGTTMAGVGSRRGGDGPAPPPLPWVPAFAGTTVGGVRDTRGLVVAEGPLRVPSGQAQGERKRASPRPCGFGRSVGVRGGHFAGTAVGGARDTRGLVVAEGPSTGSGRTESRIAPTVLVGARGVWGSGFGYTTGLTPPSMFMAVPVMKLARSEARKVMRLAASSDSPTRPRGTFTPIAA